MKFVALLVLIGTIVVTCDESAETEAGGPQNEAAKVRFCLTHARHRQRAVHPPWVDANGHLKWSQGDKSRHLRMQFSIEISTKPIG